MRYALDGLMAGNFDITRLRVSAKMLHNLRIPGKTLLEIFFYVTTCYVMLLQSPVTHICICHEHPHHHQSTNSWPEPISTQTVIWLVNVCSVTIYKMQMADILKWMGNIIVHGHRWTVSISLYKPRRPSSSVLSLSHCWPCEPVLLNTTRCSGLRSK